MANRAEQAKRRLAKRIWPPEYASTALIKVQRKVNAFAAWPVLAYEWMILSEDPGDGLNGAGGYW
jgi:hypothetical protein